MKQFFKFTLAVICALLIWGVIKLFIFIGVIGSLGASGAGTTIAKPHSVYELELRGSVVEYQDEKDRMTTSMMQALDNEEYVVYGLNEILANIRKAKNDPNVDGIYLHGGNMQMGYATAQTLHEALLDFRKSGKFVIAYADSYAQKNYYVATAADKVFVNPDGVIGWAGMGLTLSFYTKMLEKLGVEMQVVKVGTFKSAVEPFIRTDMSEPNRLQCTMLLNDIWQKVCADVSAARMLSEQTLNELADRNMTYAQQEEYVIHDMVDGLCYVQDVDSMLAELTGTDDYELLDYDGMIGLISSDKPQKNKVAILYAEGDITDDQGDGIVGKKMVETIGDIMDEDDVKAVVFRINSGGGSAYASEQINHAISLLKKDKPVVVSMGDYAASGGYYIACNANYIFAEPTTLTGSIGIFGLLPNVKGVREKVGLTIDGVQTHKHANMQSNIIMQGMNAEERQKMQCMIDRGYELFTRRCAEGRGISQDSIKVIGEGRVWSGTKALEIGLVDELGSLQNAIAKAAELAGLEQYELAEYPEPDDMWEQLLEAFGSSARIERTLERAIGSEHYQSIRYMERLAAEPSVQARMPYYIDIE